MVRHRQRERSVFEVILPDADKLWPDDWKGRFKDNSDKPTGMVLCHDLAPCA